MEHNEDYEKNYNKYLKYKIKYLDLLQEGGVLDKPNMAHDPKYAPDLTMPVSHRSGVDTKNPYYATEFGRTNTKKKDIFNFSKKYADFPDFNGPLAYIGEHPKTRPVYCVRKPHYPKKSIRIISYNVHNWVKQCSDTGTDKKIKFHVGRNDIPMMSTIINLIPDIAFLQEIVPIYPSKPKTDADIEKGNFQQLIDEFTKIGLPYHYIADTHYSTEKGALDTEVPYFMLCNAIFSRYEIMSHKSVELGNNRIAIVCFIKLPNSKYITCYNVHIEFKDSLVDRAKNNLRYKQVQINNLAKAIYNDSKALDDRFKDVMYVLAGDFNNEYVPQGNSDIPSAGINFNPITDMLQWVPPKLSVDEGDNNRIMTGQNVQRIIDHFFISKNVELPKPFSLIVPDNNSDHYPIVLDINI